MATADPEQMSFEQWASLAREDMARFEACRSEAIEAAIQSAPSHRRARLRGLQWQIEQIRATSGTPLAACIRISNMMWESITSDDGLIARMEALKGERRLPRRRGKADILPFRRPQAH